MNERNALGATLSAAKVNKRLRRFDKSFALYRNKLVECHGEETARRITELTRREYALLLPRTPQFAGRLNLFNWAIGVNAIIVALHKAMRADGKTAEQTARVLFAAADEEHRAIPGLIRWIAGRVFFSRLFLWLAQRSAELVRNHPQGWNIDYRSGDGNACDWYFECTDCGVVKYYRKHGAEDLAPYCNFVDFIQSRAFGLGLQNPDNIGQGGCSCREFFKQGRETCLPDNLVSIARGGSEQRTRAA